MSVRTVAVDDVVELGPGAQLVEVLPREEFEWAHLPGALHLPLRRLDAATADMLDRRRPVIAYCNDFL